MRRSSFFLLCLLAFIAGCFAGLFYPSRVLALGVLICGIGALAVRKRAALIILVFGLGLFRSGFAWKANEFQDMFGQKEKQVLQGYVLEDPQIINNTRLVVRPGDFSQSLIITTSNQQTFNYGDLLYIKGKVVQPKASADFDYPNYLRQKIFLGK